MSDLCQVYAEAWLLSLTPGAKTKDARLALVDQCPDGWEVVATTL